MLSSWQLFRVCRLTRSILQPLSKPLTALYPSCNFCSTAGATNSEKTPSFQKETEFHPKKILLLRKITRYEYEKRLRPDDTEEQLKQYLTCKGSDYNGLLQRHTEYQKALDQIQENLQRRSLNCKVVKRYDYQLEHIEWADAILSAGGDGTFLMAAAKVKDRNKPLIGINTDPIRSEGVLCLPKKLSVNLDTAFDRLFNGKFQWKWRQRIRITLSGKHTGEPPVNLYDQELMYPEHRFWEHVKENEMLIDHSECPQSAPAQVLPILALNEVFIGESLSARVSFYEMSMNDSPQVKQKSSGVTLCTGTGSTSWFFNINHIPVQSIQEILAIAKDTEMLDVNLNDDSLMQRVASQFNNSLIFDPSEPKMAYTVRDPVAHGIFQVSSPRGFCTKMQIKSRMWDAWIVVDGGISFRFNDGAQVLLEMFDEDALRCVTMN